MAADVSITMEAQNKGVIQAMDQVGKKADQLNRKTQAMGGGSQRQGGYTQGMGVLEVSRAIEDAQYGIRGVLNNIPSIIQSFGGSMGLAGVVSIAAVAVSVLGKELFSLVSPAGVAAEKLEKFKAASESLTASLKELRDTRAAKELAAEIELLNTQSREFIDTTLKFNANPTAAFEVNEKDTQMARAAADEIENLSNKLKELKTGEEQKSPLDIGVKRAEEDIARLEKLISDLRERGPSLGEMLGADNSATFGGVDSVTNKLILAKGAVAGYEAEIKSLEENMGGFSNAIKEYAIDFAALFLSGKENPAAEMAATRKQMGFTLPETEYGNKLGIARGEMALAEKKMKALEAQLKIEEAAIANGATVRDQYEKEMQANEASLKSAEEKLRVSKSQLTVEQEKERLAREIAKYGEMQDQPNVADWQKWLKSLDEPQQTIVPFGPSVQDFLDYQNKLNENISSNLSGFRMNPSDMLSSSGRIGGSVKEYSSAVATVNYQRETLKALKDIARNTRTGKVSTYN
jgi:hypothetical protein